MSTTDPAAQRHDEVVGQRGSARQLQLGLAGLVLLAAGAAAFGVAFSILAEEVRHTVLDDAFDDRATRLTSAPWSLPVCFVVGFAAIALGALLYRRAILRYRGGERPWPLPGATGVIAFSCGFIALVPQWLAPVEVGSSPDSVFGGEATWGTGSWIAYRATIWLPLLLVALSALACWRALRAHGADRSAAQERDRLLAVGRRTQGTVHELAVRTTSDDTGGRRVVGALVTIRFTDDAGTARHLERYVSASTVEVSSIRDVEVLYDPLRPDATTSIYLTFRPVPLPSDWVGPTAKERRRAS